MAKKLKNTDLIRIIDQEIALADTYGQKISQARAKSLKYYYGDPYGNEQKGRSSTVTTDVFNTISWALPQILKILSSEEVAKFEASVPGAEMSAEFATEYAKYCLYRKNPGFNILYTAIQDALLQKNGVVKVFVDKTPEYTREEYEGLNDQQLSMLLSEPNIELFEVDSTEGQIDPMTGQQTQTHDVTIKRRINKEGTIKIDNVPPEELIVSRSVRSLRLDDANFVAHRVKKTISWLREQGYKIDDDINDGSQIDDGGFSSEKLQRESQIGYDKTNDDTTPVDPSQRLVTVVEAYLKVDFDGDGIAEYRKITKIGHKILDNEVVYCQPFIATSPYPQSHEFYGLSMADVVMPLQLQKSMIRRALQDSFAFSISPPKAVNITNLIDINDLLDSNTPGSFIKMKGDVNNALAQLPTAPVASEAFNLLEHIDNQIESTAGVSRMTQGIDTNAINRTATGTAAIMSATQEKIALLVRVFAETLVAEIYKKIVKLASIYIDKPEIIKINGQYQQVNPNEWQSLDTIEILVGTGAVDRQQDAMNLQGIIQLQQTLVASGKPEAMALVSPDKFYNTLAQLSKAMGYKNPEMFFNNPATPQYQQMLQFAQQSVQPPPDPNLQFVEVEKQKAEQTMLINTAEFELKKLEADRDFEINKLKAAIEWAKVNQKDDQFTAQQAMQIFQSINPSQSLLPQSEIAALEDVARIKDENAAEAQKQAQAMQPPQPEQQPEQPPMEPPAPPPDPNQQAIIGILQHLQSNNRKPAAFRMVRDENNRLAGVVPVFNDDEGEI